LPNNSEENHDFLPFHSSVKIKILLFFLATSARETRQKTKNWKQCNKRTNRIYHAFKSINKKTNININILGKHSCAKVKLSIMKQNEKKKR
jgi:hypothetical protein